MDLAEIRKKANLNRDSAPVSDNCDNEGSGRSTISVQGVPSESPMATSPERSADRTVLSDDETSAGGLEWLFNATDLAGDEGDAGEEGDEQQERKSAEDKDLLRLLCFSLGDEEYALDIENIREIIKPREITDIPRAPGFVLGIISLRGIIVPVFDLKQRLKLGSSCTSPVSRIVVCQEEERIVGLLVDSISQVVRIPKEKIELPPSVLSGLDRDLVEGVGRYEGRMMILLNLSCVINAELV